MKKIRKRMSKYHRIILLELKKIGAKKLIFVMVALTIPMICIHLYAIGGRERYREVLPEREFMKDICGSLTEEKYNRIVSELEALKGTSLEEEDELIMEESKAHKEEMAKEGIYGKTKGEDISILEQALFQCNMILNMEKNKTVIFERAQKNLEKSGEDDKYSRAYNNKIMEMLNRQQESKIMGINTCYSFFFSESKYWVFMVMAQVIILSGLFTKEKESGMMPVIRASREATRGNFIAKYVVMIMVSVFVTVYFQIIKLILCGYTYGFTPEYLNYPIRMLRDFHDTLYNFTIWQLLILDVAVKILVMIFLGNVLILISLLAKKTVTSMCVSLLSVAVLLGIPYWFMTQLAGAGESLKVMEMACNIKRYVCTSSMSTRLYYSEYHAVNFFGMPVSEITLNCMICIVMIMILTVVSATVNKKGVV